MSARYRVTEPLGRGMRVFRGVAESIDGDPRNVVILRALPSMTGHAKFLVGFLADLLPSLRLKYANIVELLDIAKTPDDVYFVVTEYVDGVDLNVLVARRKRIALPQVIHHLIECCKALACVHASGLIHRDISPRSVLLSATGTVKLAGLGLARANSQRESTDPGVVKGNFSYLSPEAASGREVDHRSDVFAAGILLWELLAGRRLFLGETDYQTVVLVREARFVAIEGLDPSLDTIMRTALARDPGERYQSANDLAEALAHYVVSRNIEVSSGSALVHDVQLEIRRERSLAPPVDLAGVRAEVARMYSIVTEGPAAGPRRAN